MARQYVLSAQNVTAGNKTMAFVHPSTTQSLEIVRVEITQNGSTTSAMQRIQLVRQASAYPTLVSATPLALNESDGSGSITGGTAGAAGTAGITASAEGAGAKTVLFEDAFNVLTGYLYVPVPEERIVLAAGSTSGFGVYFPAAPSSTSGWNVKVVWREVP